MTGLQHVPETGLRDFTTALLVKAGAPEDIADEVAAHLVRSNLSGHDSHGVARLPQYVAQIDRSELDPGARPVVLAGTGAVASYDARRGFGQFSTAVVLEATMRRAQETGVAAASVRRSMHIGRLGEYSERAAADGLVTIVTAGSAGAEVGGVGMPGARGRFFGTNPWSFGFPGQDRTVMFDGSMSTVAEGKVRLTRAAGKSLPPGCIVDREGQPSQDPAAFYDGGALLPLGGEVAGHKGYGLALASALLGGLSAAGDPDPTVLGAAVTGDGERRGRVSGVFMAVLDPAAFGGPGYCALVKDVAEGIKRAPSAGTGVPTLPGEPEQRARQQRTAEGIPLPEATRHDLRALSGRFGLKTPF
jgi:hydroxycarboxylate dehydrogenase B